MARPKATIRVLLLAACAWSGGASAQQGDSLLKSAAKIAGFATDVAPPADFVLQSRPQTDQDYIPVFQPPPEPAKPVLSDKDLKTVRGDLDAVGKAHDAIRAAFPPAAKAVAEEKAAEAKKAQAKPPAASQ